MKSTNFKSSVVKSVVVAVALLSMAAPQVQAQDTPPILILDVAKVFKDNEVFDAKLKAIKAEADQLKDSITAEQEQIKNRAQQLQQLERGTAERNKLEMELETQQAELRAKARQAEVELLNREARIYYDTYRQMQAVVEEIANSYKVSLVLRFDSSEIDSSNRNEVIKAVNRSVVYFGKIDLTSTVTAELNKRMRTAGNVGPTSLK